MNDSVQNQVEIAQRFCTKTVSGGPYFYIGCSPSQASTIINPSAPAAGCMVSVNQLRHRKSDFEVGDWILDSGAFTEVARYGGYSSGVEEYYWQIRRWSHCGHLLIAVAQDWMCEPFVLSRTGLDIPTHQKLTIERYQSLINLAPPVEIMPVLQGYKVSDYLNHIYEYGDILKTGQWAGVGSVCKRNGNPTEVVDILRSIKLIRPDLRLHGFGLKLLALENPEVKNLLYSCDSMAWSFPLRFHRPDNDSVQKQCPISLAHEYQEKIAEAVDSVQKRLPPSTAGAGNGQGRKPKWKSKTIAIRVPEKYADRLIQVAKNWEKNEEI